MAHKKSKDTWVWLFLAISALLAILRITGMVFIPWVVVLIPVFIIFGASLAMGLWLFIQWRNYYKGSDEKDRW